MTPARDASQRPGTTRASELSEAGYVAGPVEGRRQKELVLILAREFASKLATPMFVADRHGDLVFYNEPAEEVLGRTFAEAGEMPAGQWTLLFRPEDLQGRPLSLEAMPSGIALRERRPAHGTFRITGLDGRRRVVSVTAFPLFARAEEFSGMVSIFWEHAGVETP
jgi:PAS domain-containing protein